MKFTNVKNDKKDNYSWLKGDLEFRLSCRPYDICLRGNIEGYDLDFKTAIGSRYEFHRVLYYTKRFESSIFIYEGKIVIENIDKDFVIKDFVIELLDIGFIKKIEEKCYV